MTKPRLVKVRALFYVLQQVMTWYKKRVHQDFDTPSSGSMRVNVKPGERMRRNQVIVRAEIKKAAKEPEIFVCNVGIVGFRNLSRRFWRIA